MMLGLLLTLAVAVLGLLTLAGLGTRRPHHDALDEWRRTRDTLKEGRR